MLPFFASGCMTQKLWTDMPLDEWNQPATSPNLQIFDDQHQHDLLVVYDEYSDRRCSTRRRAYFLQQNDANLKQHARPHFVSSSHSNGLAVVPVLYTAPAVSPNQLYAVTATNSTCFSVFSGRHELCSHELPVYNDGVGPAERVAFTPVTVTMDATIIGGVCGYICLYALAESNFQWRP